MSPSEKELAEIVKAARRVLDEADLPAELRPVAFEKIYESLTGQEGAIGKTGDGLFKVAAKGESSSSDTKEIERAATKLRLDADRIERVIDFDDDGVHIMASRSRFDPKKSGATQQVALLIAGVRQASGLEEWTSLDVIREACANLGVEDRGNFAAHIKKLQGVRQRGSGRAGELKMNAVGFEAASALIEVLGGETP